MILKACPAYRGCRATVPLGFCGLVALVSSWPGLLATVVQATPRRLTSRTLHWTAAGAGAGLDASGRRDWRGGSSARPASRRDTAVGGPGQAVAGGVSPGMGGAAGREHRRRCLRLHPRRADRPLGPQPGQRRQRAAWGDIRLGARPRRDERAGLEDGGDVGRLAAMEVSEALGYLWPQLQELTEVMPA